MAKSFSHKWGQIIGNLIQDFIRETLQEIADEHSLYLDYQNLRKARIVKQELLKCEKAKIDDFVNHLIKSFTRKIQQVNVIVLHGLFQEIATVENAIEYIENYSENPTTSVPISKYEIDIRYNNADVSQVIFEDKIEAIKFLRSFIERTG